jgi:hypothetical protein
MVLGALMRRGLSSLGQSASRVVPTLDAIITSLAEYFVWMTWMSQATRQKIPSFRAPRRSPPRQMRSLAEASAGETPASW